MKKPIERRDIIIRGASKEWITNHGCQSWANKNFKFAAIYFVLLMAAVWIYGDYIDIDTASIATKLAYLITCGLIFLGVYVYGSWRYLKAGKDFWNKYKDSTQPIELPKLPKVSWGLWKKADKCD